MLFILTGTVQTGKTRWLCALVDTLEERGISCYGVLAPGIWISSESIHADANGFEKQGIENILLPEKARITFAVRRDLARAQGIYDAQSQSAQAGLGWHISDAAIDRVNDHLSKVRLSNARTGARGMLIVDELGRLELECGGGLHEAVTLLEEGPIEHLFDALVVARDGFADIVERRFGETWGGVRRIAPDEQGWEAVLERA